MPIQQVKTIQGQKRLLNLSGSVPTGNPVGTLLTTYKKIQPRNYLYCDGRDTTGTDEELRTHYPALYMYLGSNVLPDFRECVMVGAEENSTDSIATHDVYAQGQFKDDQMQSHYHNITHKNNSNPMNYTGTTATSGNNLGGFVNAPSGVELLTIGQSGRKGTPDVTHGKQKAVYVYIKAVDGVDISDEDSFIGVVQNYIDEKFDTVETYEDNGIFVRKSGRVVSVIMMKTVSGGAGTTVATLPEKYRPVDNVVPTAFFNNNTDEVIGQSIIYLTGEIKIWGNGTLTNIPLRASWCYIV